MVTLAAFDSDTKTAPPKSGNPLYQWIIARPDGTDVAELTEARTRKLELQLDDASQATWTMPGRHAQTALVTELSTDLVIARNRELIYRGRVNASDDTVSPTVHTCTFSAIDYRGMLGRRIQWPGSLLNYVGWEQTTIVLWLIAETQNLGPLGINTDELPITGINRDRTYDVGKNIGEAITELGQCVNGFEWDVSPHLQLRIFYPRRGHATPVVLEYGRNLSDVRRTVTSSDFANALRYSGSEDIPAVTRELPPGPEGRFERQDGNPDVVLASTLNEQADGAFAEASQIKPAYVVNVMPGYWDPETMWLGDAVRLIVRSGRLDVDTDQLRIVGLTLDVDENGIEAVQLNVGATASSLFQRLSDAAARLDRLERR